MASLRSHLTSTSSNSDRFSNPVLLVWGYLVSLGDKLQTEMESLFSSSSDSSSNSTGASSSTSSAASFSFSSASSLSAWLGRTVFDKQQQRQHQQQQGREGKHPEPQRLQQQRQTEEEPRRQQQQKCNMWDFSLSDLLRKLSSSSMPPTSSARRSARAQQQQQQQQQRQQETGAPTITAPSTPSTDDSAVAGRASTSSVRIGCSRKLLPAVTAGTRARATDKTLVLDLDETLIHARTDVREMGEGRFDFMLLLSNQREQQRQQEAQEQELLLLQQQQQQQQQPKRSLLHALGKKRSTAAPAADGTRDACPAQKRGERRSRRVYVRKRPHLREFLEAASELFEVVLFTAAPEEFANAVMEHVDPERKLVDHVLSRESCTRLDTDSSSSSSGGRSSRRGGAEMGVDFEGANRKRGPTSMVKDLGMIGRPLSKVIMVENSLDAIRYHLENGVKISSFYGEGEDSELLSTLDALRALAPAEDVRDGIIRLSVETQARKEGKMLMLDDALLTTG